MKKLLAVCAIVSCSYVQAQKQTISINDAVMLQRTKLAPARLAQLAWLPNTDTYYCVANNALLINGVKGLDTFLKVADLQVPNLKSFPSIKWEGGFTKFSFTNGNTLYEQECTLPKKASKAIANYPEDAENVDIAYSTDKIAYTVGNNLYISSGMGQSAKITDETNADIVCGQAAHRNEFGITKGTFWSNKQTKLAYYRMDQTMVTNYPLVDISTTPATLNNIKYPMAGQKSHQATIGVYDLTTRKTVYLKTTGDPEQYLTNITWSPDDAYIYIAIVNRNQNEMHLCRYNASTGALDKDLFTEKNDRYVEPEHGPVFNPTNPSQFVWFSERDGFNHLYLYKTDGSLVKQLTKGNFVVTEILGFDTKAENLFYMVTANNAMERQAMSVNLTTGLSNKITTTAGMHTCIYNAFNNALIDQYSSLTVPRVTQTISAQGKVIKPILASENPLKDYQLGETSLFSIKAADGTTDLNCRLIKPANFDASKKYPVIVYLYNGPHLQLVTNSWLSGADLWMHNMAAKGYVIFTVDGRGSDFRGFDFESVVHRQLGKNEMADQLKGVEYLKQQAWVDASRMGIFGWSFGGFMTTTIMCKSPETFKVGVAGGPVIDWKLYEIMYTERYMDSPEQNPKGYEEANLLNVAKNLKGKFMQIHGTDDDVVVWQHSQEFIQKTVENGVQMDYYVYPGHKHNVLGKDRVHLIQKICSYFEDNL